LSSHLWCVLSDFDRFSAIPASFSFAFVFSTLYNYVIVIVVYFKLLLFCWKACSPLNIYHAIDSDYVSQSDCRICSIRGWFSHYDDKKSILNQKELIKLFSTVVQGIQIRQGKILVRNNQDTASALTRLAVFA